MTGTSWHRSDEGDAARAAREIQENGAQGMNPQKRGTIVGIGETEYTRGSEHGSAELMLQAARAAIADAGLSPREIDGIIPPPLPLSGEEIAANLGVEDLRYSVTVHMGGASPTAALQSASLAVTNGLAQNVLVVLGWLGYSAMRQNSQSRQRENPGAGAMQRAMAGYYLPYGAAVPAQFYAWLATRHMQLYGTRYEDMAAVALASSAIALRRMSRLTLSSSALRFASACCTSV